MKTINIFSKFKSNDVISFKNIGNFCSDDRFYTYINETIDNKLKETNRFVRLIINFLYSSSNYKHDPNINKKFSWGAVLLDIFFILCLIAFIACLFSGVLTPLINWISKKTPGFHLNTSQWVLLGFAIFFMIISIFYLILVFRFKKTNKSLSLQVYVQKKLNTILYLKGLFKLNELNKKKEKEKKLKNPEILLLDNGQNSSMPTIWLSVQILNTLSLLFDDICLGIVIQNVSIEDSESIIRIVDNDFLSLTYQVIDVTTEKPYTLSYSNPNVYNLPVAAKSTWINTLFIMLFGGTIGGILGAI